MKRVTRWLGFLIVALFPASLWAAGGVVKSPARGTVPDPLTEFIKQGRWMPAEEAQAEMIKDFKKEHGM